MADVESVHIDYAARASEWAMLRDVLAGSRAVKAAGNLYLPALGGQTNTTVTGTYVSVYDAYKQRAKFYAATARTQQALVGTIFHKDLVVEGPDDLKAQLKDVTLSDTPIEDFAVLALSEIVGLGRFGILVDMPDEVDPTENRPYWVGYRTEQIVNWRETSTNGDTYLTLVVLKEHYEVEINEYETKKRDQYRVLQLIPNAEAEGGLGYVQRVFQQSPENDKVFVQVKELTPVKAGKPLSFIPFLVIGPTTLTPCPEKPPLSEMAETNLHMYRRSADLEHGRHFTGLPTPVIIGMPPPPPGQNPTVFTIGSSRAWDLPPGCDVKYLEFTGQGLGALVEGMKEDKEEMAELGSEMFAPEQDTGAETATAVRVRHSSKTASLKTIARRLATGLTKCLRWHAYWMGATQDLGDERIEAKINTVFLDTKMAPEDMKAWVLAVQAGTVSAETFYAQLEKGELTRPGVDWEQEKEAIDAESAAASQMAADSAALMADAVPPAPSPVPAGTHP